MARIYIEPHKAKMAALDEQTLATKLTRLSGEVDSVNRNLRYKIAGQEQISEQLRLVVEQIARESTSTKNLRDALDQIVNQYTVTENGNRDREVADKTLVKKPDMIFGWWEPFGWSGLTKKVFEKLLGPFGFAPDAFSAETLSDWLSVLLGVGDSVISMVGAEGTGAEWWKDVFDLNPLEYTSFRETFLGKLGKFDTPVHTAGTIVNWAEKIVDSYVKNNEEFDGNWCARFWEETVTEAGIKLAEGAAVTAGVSAATAGICAAIGVACPPALVVGVAAAGVGMALDWALDGVVSWATGGSCTSWIEGASDLICDGVDWARDQLGSAVQKGQEALHKAKDAVVDGYNAAKDKAKNVVDGIGNVFSGGVSWLGSLL